MAEPVEHWLLGLPKRGFANKVVALSTHRAQGYVERVRGGPTAEPVPDWAKDKSSKFGEDLVGGWLLANGGLTEGVERQARIAIPEHGSQPRRTVDWLLGKRIIVEVKTYAKSVSKGAYLEVTHQFNDYAFGGKWNLRVGL